MEVENKLRAYFLSDTKVQQSRAQLYVKMDIKSTKYYHDSL